MLRTDKILFLFSALFVFFGCSSGTIQVTSQPDGADVYVSSSSQPSKKLGLTPLTLTEAQVANSNEPFQITITKQGFESSNTLVPATTLSRNVTLSARLQDLSGGKTGESTESLQKVASQVAQTQNLIRSKDYLQAEKNLLFLISQFSNVATFHELLGNVYYLKKDTTAALASYKKANELAPGNPDTLRIINKLQILKVDTNGGTQ